jgi:hypothetical protein
MRPSWLCLAIFLFLCFLTEERTSFGQVVSDTDRFNDLFNSPEQKRIQLLLQSHHLFEGAGMDEPIRDSEITVEEIVRLIKDGKASTVEELLSQLPIEVRSNLALVYESGSLQKGSYQNPRAILFTLNGHLALTFNGHSQHQGFNRVEIMQWRPDKKIFDFYEINFEHRSPEISENPQQCFACHGGKDDPRLRRPIWDSYQVWPQMYDSAEDLFATQFDNAEQKQVRVNRETTEWRKFAHLAKTHPRYKYLNLDEFEFNLSKTLNHGVNARHSTRLMRLNLERMANYISQQSNYKNFEPAITAALIQCRDLESFFPEQMKVGLSLEDTYRQVQAYQNAEIAKQFDLLMQFVADEELKYNQSDYQRPQNRYESTQQDTALQYVLEKMGLDLSQFSMSRTQAMGLVDKSYMFDGFQFSVSDMIHFIAPSRDFTAIDKEKVCGELKKISLERLQEFKPKGQKKLKSNGPELIKVQCAGCHEQNKMGTKPYAISFVNEEAFKNELKNQDFRLLKDMKRRIADNASVEIKMPPTHDLNEEDRQMILDYISELVVLADLQKPFCKSEDTNVIEKIFERTNRSR